MFRAIFINVSFVGGYSNTGSDMVLSTIDSSYTPCGCELKPGRTRLRLLRRQAGPEGPARTLANTRAGRGRAGERAHGTGHGREILSAGGRARRARKRVDRRFGGYASYRLFIAAQEADLPFRKKARGHIVPVSDCCSVGGDAMR